MTSAPITVSIQSYDQFKSLQTGGWISSKTKFIDRSRQEVFNEVKARSTLYSVSMMITGLVAAGAVIAAIASSPATLFLTAAAMGLFAISTAILAYQHYAMNRDGLQSNTALTLGEGLLKATGVCVIIVLVVLWIAAMSNSKSGYGGGCCDGFMCGYIFGSWANSKPTYHSYEKSDPDPKTRRGFVYLEDKLELLQSVPVSQNAAPPSYAPSSAEPTAPPPPYGI